MVIKLQPGTATRDRFCCRFSAAAVPRRGERGAAVRPEVPPQPMTLHAQALALTAFAVVMAAAAFEDFRRLVIPNPLPIALCALCPLYFAAAPSLYGAF